MSENAPSGSPDTVTTEQTPVKYPEQSPNRKDAPIMIPVKPAERK